MAKPLEKVVEFTDDKTLISVLYRSVLSAIVTSFGIGFAFVKNEQSRIEFPVGLLMILIGLVILVFALVKLIPMLRAGHSVRWGLLALGVMVVVPLVVLVINLLS